MSAILSVLIVICCIALILAVLIQNPKGGVTSNFSAGTAVMGVRRTADFLEKATWTLVVLLFIFSIATVSIGKQQGGSGPSETSTTKDKAADFDQTTPTTAPNQLGGGTPPPAKATPVKPTPSER